MGLPPEEIDAACARVSFPPSEAAQFCRASIVGSEPPQLHEKEAHPEEIQGSWWQRSWSFPTISQLPSVRVLRRRPYRTRRCQLGVDKSQSILLQPFFPPLRAP